ncbi:hypothetical protein HHK36_001983 [Tetracentron sinense]|uniref:Uncharacterized protein n=1 Tax=Tetracentron sinense TaxID=13715 RepID=A0A834ZY88_TETSI|nr:hypothetical protein HHK36_001983 [Tetracentron sinense]
MGLGRMRMVHSSLNCQGCFAIQKHDLTERGVGKKTVMSKDAQDLLSKPTQQQFGVSVDAAILQAATRRGLRNLKLDIFPKTVE